MINIPKAHMILAQQSKTCKDCKNKDGGLCKAFEKGFKSIHGTSFVNNEKCQAYLTEDEKIKLEQQMKSYNPKQTY